MMHFLDRLRQDRVVSRPKASEDGRNIYCNIQLQRRYTISGKKEYILGFVKTA